MQITPLPTAAPSTLVPTLVASDVATPLAPRETSSARIASATDSAALQGVLDGVARLIDFPGIAAGDMFDVAKGSKVGIFGVKGEAQVTRLEDNAASFRVKAGAFGIKVDVVIDVERTGPETVRISSRGTGIPDQSGDGRIVASRTNYAEFVRVDNEAERTVISHDGNGRVTIDAVVPTFGNAHLLLDKRR